ncbi:hypothetical protein HYX70_04390 [Candidatus Saccharibacteria bacterium]|nr:hypothetical protein [Candidatus Saccharibacteria bacterium]
MKAIKHSQQGFSVVELIIIVLIIIILAAIGYFLYRNNAKTTMTSTECFTVSVPAKYTITNSGGNRCQFVAKLGSSNMVLIVPFTESVNSKEQADTILKEGSPRLATSDISVVDIDGRPAEMFSGVSKPADQPEKLLYSYLAYGTNPYRPSGSGKTINAFSIKFVFEPNNTSKAEIDRIVKSINWR